MKIVDSFRGRLDKYLQSAIRLVMATGVCFTVTACYAPAPIPEGWENPPYDPNDTTCVIDTMQDMRRIQRLEQQERIEQMAENLRHNGSEYEDNGAAATALKQ